MLKNRTALVTGSNGALGRAIVAALARNQARVLAHARKETPEFLAFIEQVAGEAGAEIIPVFFDITDGAALKNVLREMMKSWPVNILVNNAGRSHGGFIQMTRPEDLRAVFDANFFAPVEITRFLLRHIAKSGNGSIINVGSVLGMEPFEGGIAYSTSKAALLAFTKVLAAEAGPLGIRANMVAPGLIDTGMGNDMAVDFQAKMVSQCDMGRKGKPAEIAETVCWLASDAASYVNGSVIRVDGGRKW